MMANSRKIYKLSHIYIKASDQFDQLNSLLWDKNMEEPTENISPKPEPPIQPESSTQKAVGFSVPGYQRVITNVDKDLQQKAMQILQQIRNQPLGTKIPFVDERTGTKYMAVLERHAPSPTIPRYHPGISLFVSSSPANSQSQNPRPKLPGQRQGLSSRTLQKIQELDPIFQPQIIALMTQAVNEGLKPEIVEGYRSQKRQDQLHSEGKTPTRSSMHTRRLAVDIAQLDDNGNITYNTTGDFYPRMGEIAKNLGINWGGYWKQTDRPHFQYRYPEKTI